MAKMLLVYHNQVIYSYSARIPDIFNTSKINETESNVVLFCKHSKILRSEKLEFFVKLHKSRKIYSSPVYFPYLEYTSLRHSSCILFAATGYIFRP